MDFTATFALVIFTLFLCAFIGVQYYLDRKRERQFEREREKAERIAYFASNFDTTDDRTEREKAIARSHVVKHQKRRARQRKAARRKK